MGLTLAGEKNIHILSYTNLNIILAHSKIVPRKFFVRNSGHYPVIADLLSPGINKSSYFSSKVGKEKSVTWGGVNL
jgi:hypothetical protein